MTTPFSPAPVCQPTPAELAAWTEGTLLDEPLAPERISGVATLAEATGEQLSFIASDSGQKQAASSKAGLLLTSARFDVPGRARIIVTDAWLALAAVLNRMYPEPAPAFGVHATAVIDPTAEVAADAVIGPYCVVEANAKIGPGAVLGPHCCVGTDCSVDAQTRLVAHVTLVRNVHVGARCLIHPGAVLGADGFKFELTARGPLKIPQVGGVIIEDDVEIGANTCIDRAFLHETRVGRGVKLDNLVQIAHNVRIGPMTVMAAQVGVAGSARIGAGCMFGGQAGIGDSRVIGDRAIIAGQAGINGDIAPGAAVTGMPPLPIKQYMRSYAVFAKLPELSRRLRVVEQLVNAGGAEKSE